MIWILLIAFSGKLHSVEFNTKEACVTAATEMQKRGHEQGWGYGAALCTPKGEKK